MSGAVDRIPQTHRAILFETFDETRDDLATIITNNANGDIKDDKRDLLIKELEVTSFDDFLEKFSPAIYEYCQENPDGSKEFFYTLQKINPNDQVPVIKVANHGYFQMLCRLYEKRGDSGQANYEFDYKSILESLLPSSEAANVQRVRKALEMVGKQYFEKKDNNEDVSEENERLVKLRREIESVYKYSELALLPVKMEDTNLQIETVEKYIKAKSKVQDDGSGSQQLKIGTFAYDAEGRATVLPLPKAGGNQDVSGDARLALEARNTKALAERIGRDYELAKKDQANPKTKALVVSTFTLQINEARDALATKSVEELEEIHADLVSQKKEWNRLYTGAKNSFIQAMQTLVAKLINVKVFFDHATAEGSEGGKLEKGAGLIIANCPAGALVENDKISGKFLETMQTFNRNPAEKIWFGIVPDVEEGGATSGEIAGDGWDDLHSDEETVDAGFVDLDSKAPAGTESGKSMFKPTSFADLLKFLKIMDEARIVTVFNFKPDKKTNTFSGITPQYIRETRDNLAKLKRNGHAVLAYPNFTLMTGRSEQVLKDLLPEDKKDEYMIKIGDVYIGAAYVAGGLLVASQRKDTLRKLGLGKLLLAENPNVRLDMEKKEIALNLLPRFSRELAINWSPKLSDAIKDSPYGFVFCGDPIFDKSKSEYLNKAYVYLARTLKQGKKTYMPVFSTLVQDFVDIYLATGGKITGSTLKNFLKEDVSRWKEQAKRDPGMINLILTQDDDIVQDEIDKESLITKFGPIEDIIKVDIKNDDE